MPLKLLLRRAITQPSITQKDARAESTNKGLGDPIRSTFEDELGSKPFCKGMLANLDLTVQTGTITL